MRIHAFTLAGTYVVLLCCLPAFGRPAQNNPSLLIANSLLTIDKTTLVLQLFSRAERFVTNWVGFYSPHRINNDGTLNSIRLRCFLTIFPPSMVIFRERFKRVLRELIPKR
jgi:hypothetical protein